MIISANITPSKALAGNPVKVNVFTNTSDLVSISVQVTATFTYSASALPDANGACAFFIDDLFADALDLAPLADDGSLARLIPGSALDISVTAAQGAQSIQLSAKLYPGRISHRASTRVQAEGKNIFEWKLLNPAVNFLLTSRLGDRVIPFRESELEYIYFLRQDFDSLVIRDLHGHAVDVPVPAGDGVVAVNARRARYLLALQGSLASCLVLEVNGSAVLSLVLLPSADERLEIVFRNAWGVHERVEISATVSDEPLYAARETFTTLDQNTGLPSKQNARGSLSPTLTAQSGPRRASEIDFLAEMLLSQDAYMDVAGEFIPSLLSGKVKRKRPLAVPTSVEVKITARADESALTPLPPPPPKYLSIAPSIVNLPGDGTEGEAATVTSSAPWSISGKDAWIDASAEGNNLFISANENPSPSPRQGTVTVVNDDGIIADVTVRQMAAAAYITIIPNPYAANPNGENNVEFEVDTNLDEWEVTEMPDFASVEYFDHALLRVNFEPNDTGETRDGHVTLADANGNFTRDLVITQAPVPLVLLSVDGDGSITDSDVLNVPLMLPTDGTDLNFGDPGDNARLVIVPSSTEYGAYVDYHGVKMSLWLEGGITSGLLAIIPVGEQYGLRIDVDTTDNDHFLKLYRYEYDGSISTWEHDFHYLEEDTVILEIRQETVDGNLRLRVYQNGELEYEDQENGTWDISASKPLSIGYGVLGNVAHQPPYGVRIHHIEIN
ncbi:MAG: hypothetical protein LBP56_05255 [Odoribacteraceae bacterium]|jgi:hypothetical protein|nr:hypothetical protein [Odoribacteraceae bacterium]